MFRRRPGHGHGVYLKIGCEMKRIWRAPFGVWMATMVLWGVLEVVSPATLQAQEPAPVSFGKDEQEIAPAGRKFRFAVPGDWKVQSNNGIYFIQSPDQKLLMVTVLLDSPSELPTALSELDKLVVVTGAKFSKPYTTVHGLIPMQMLAGSGTMQPSGQKVELLSVTANVLERPVLTMFYVYAEASERFVPVAQKVVQSFALVLTREEAEAVKREQELRKKSPPK